MNIFAKLSPACFLAVVLPFAEVSAVAAAGKPLELTQIFGPAAIRGERAPAIRWLPDGTAYTTIEQSAGAGGVELVRYDAATGKRSVIELRTSKPLEPVDHHWSPTAQVLLLKAASGWSIYDLEKKELRPLGRDLASGSLLYPEFSPDGTRIAYVAGGNLHVEQVDGSSSLRLTSDGTELILNARGDLAYEEEFALGKAYL